MNSQQTYETARRKVEARIGFFIHLTVFVLVNAGLIVINLLTSPENLWFFWPLAGWGIGVAAHALGVFLPRKTNSYKKRWIDRVAREEAKRRGAGPA